jgi:hypothetical protein
MGVDHRNTAANAAVFALTQISAIVTVCPMALGGNIGEIVKEKLWI